MTEKMRPCLCLKCKGKPRMSSGPGDRLCKWGTAHVAMTSHKYAKTVGGSKTATPRNSHAEAIDYIKLFLATL